MEVVLHCILLGFLIQYIYISESAISTYNIWKYCYKSLVLNVQFIQVKCLVDCKKKILSSLSFLGNQSWKFQPVPASLSHCPHVVSLHEPFILSLDFVIGAMHMFL